MTSLVVTPEIDDFFSAGAPSVSEGAETSAAVPQEPPPATEPEAAPSAAAAVTPSADQGDAYDIAALTASLLQLGQDIADTQRRGDQQILRLSECVDALARSKDALGVSEAAKRIVAAADAIGGPLRAKLLGGGEETDQEITALVKTVAELNEQIKRWAAISPGMTSPTSSVRANVFSKLTKPWLIGGIAAAATMLTIVGVIVGSLISSVPQGGGALQEEVVALRQQVNLLTTQNARYKVAISEIVGAGNNLAWFYNCPAEKRPRVPNGGQSTLCAFNMTRPFELP